MWRKSNVFPLQNKRSHSAVRLLPKVEEVEGAELAAQISCRFTLTSRNLIIKSGKGRAGRHPPRPYPISPASYYPAISSCVLCWPPFIPLDDLWRWAQITKAKHWSEPAWHVYAASRTHCDRAQHGVLWAAVRSEHAELLSDWIIGLHNNDLVTEKGRKKQAWCHYIKLVNWLKGLILYILCMTILNVTSPTTTCVYIENRWTYATL